MQAACGKRHDYSLLLESRLPLAPDTLAIVDKGYKGLEKIHRLTLIPRKASKKHPLGKEDRAFNAVVSRLRIGIEHINRFLKRFKILSYRYRGKQKNFSLVASLICGIYNQNLVNGKVIE